MTSKRARNDGSAFQEFSCLACCLSVLFVEAIENTILHGER